MSEIRNALARLARTEDKAVMSAMEYEGKATERRLTEIVELVGYVANGDYDPAVILSLSVEEVRYVATLAVLGSIHVLRERVHEIERCSHELGTEKPDGA